METADRHYISEQGLILAESITGEDIALERIAAAIPADVPVAQLPVIKLVDFASIKLTSPDERFGKLFVAIQTSGMLSDSKTFVDAIPLASDQEILESYEEKKNKPGFKLIDFITDNFAIPLDNPPHFATDLPEANLARNAAEHMNILWDALTRQPGAAVDSGSLIPLPNAYVVPGGRFREIYYWDSYFTMLGLQASGRWDLIENMVDNFSYLIDKLGFIPNGNRTYYLTRSQPPFYSLMVKLLEQRHGTGVLKKYLPQLQREYDYWMDGTSALNYEKPARKHVVLLPDGSVVNRYWDECATPRPESYIEDIELVKAHHLSSERYRDIRAAAESGWDFSGRWFKDHGNMSSIHTTEIIPVDLNTLLYHHEQVLAEAYQQVGDLTLQQRYLDLAEKRKQVLQNYMWNEQEGFFQDYDFVSQRQTKNKTLAAMFPLFFRVAGQQQAEQTATVIERDFLRPGGVTTTLNNTHQQWDTPNGWAPLHWITIIGLKNYHQHDLANVIQQRWIDLNLNVYKNNGKMVEKYDVCDMDLAAGGGEYPLQDGFGWTNGVLLKLLET
jgi:alpha,alpha-trehalase